MERVDIVIPTYKPGKEFFNLIKLLNAQTVSPERIIVMNTEEKYWSNLIYGTDFYDIQHNVEVYHLSIREFDHGKTRHEGMIKTDAPIVLFMTQDAVPADEYLIENLLKALQGDHVAVAYARQLARDDSGILEQYTRTFNYPEESKVKSKADLNELGIKTFFCSNVCAAYNRKIYQELGGFIRKTIFNEDMIYAAKVIRNDYKIAYAADAKVYHSHHYTNKMQFKRNFDLGVSQIDHPEAFEGIKSESEGKKLVKKSIEFLRKNKRSAQIPGLIITTGYKYMGYLFGKNYKKLSHKVIMKCTMSPNYWNR